MLDSSDQNELPGGAILIYICDFSTLKELGGSGV